MAAVAIAVLAPHLSIIPVASGWQWKWIVAAHDSATDTKRVVEATVTTLDNDNLATVKAKNLAGIKAAASAALGITVTLVLSPTFASDAV